MQTEKIQREFLQSEEWKNFQQNLGIEAFEVSHQGIHSLVCQMHFISNKSFLFIPRGPWGEAGADNIQGWIEKLKEEGKRRRSVFIHLEPAYGRGNPLEAQLVKFGFKPSPKEIEPRSTYFLELNRPLPEIFQSFRRGMRYNIKYSEREGLELKIREDNEAAENFIGLYRKTASGLRYKPFPENYYRLMCQTLLGKIAKIFEIRYQGKIISSTIFIFYNKRATALHTFALPQCKKLKCLSYALFQGIAYAKENGFEIFDFWGARNKKGLEGSAQLKENFNAKIQEYGAPLDYVLDKKYYHLWKIYRKIKSI